MFKLFAIFPIILLLCVSALCEPVLATPADQDPPPPSLVDPAVQKPTPPQTSIDAVTGMAFVLVKGGCFQMGSPLNEKGRVSDEGELHEVCLDDFWMGRTEVTNSQFRFYKSAHESSDYLDHHLNDDAQPVVYVNWVIADSYATWLSRKAGKKYRLPTEAEWEYAARGKTSTAQYWGDDQAQTCAYANVGDQTAKQEKIGQKFYDCTDGFALSAPVASFKPNAYGLYDMLGNVWEWTGDWYNETPDWKNQKQNPQGPTSGSFRVLRGASWFNGPDYARAAQRSWYRPDSSNNSLGFRLVMSVTP